MSPPLFSRNTPFLALHLSTTWWHHVKFWFQSHRIVHSHNIHYPVKGQRWEILHTFLMIFSLFLKNMPKFVELPFCYFTRSQKILHNSYSSRPWAHVEKISRSSDIRCRTSTSYSIVCKILKSPIISLPVGRGHIMVWPFLFVLVRYTHTQKKLLKQ